MASSFWVKGSQGCDGTPAEWAILGVSMLEGAYVAKVESGRRKDGL